MTDFDSYAMRMLTSTGKKYPLARIRWQEHNSRGGRGHGTESVDVGGERTGD